MPALAAFLMEVQTFVSTAPVDLNPRGMMKLTPAEMKQLAPEVESASLISTPYVEVVGGGVAVTQHCKSEGPVQ